jgi:hypothetical protein
MKRKKIFSYLVVLFIALFGSISSVFAAGSVNVSLSADKNSVVVNNNVVITINLSNISGASDGKAYGCNGYLNYDTQYLEYTGRTAMNDWAANVKTETGRLKLMIYDGMLENGVSNGGIVKLTFKAIKTGSTTISLSDIVISDKAGAALTPTLSNKTITITEPAPVLDSNSKLSDLKVNGTTVSGFSGNTKNYTVTVPRDTTSVDLAATAASSKAKRVEGTGTKNITQESQTFTIRCIAENDSYTDYNVTIKKEAEQHEPEPEPQKSSDSSLKSLSVSGYRLSPSFKSGTTDYSMTVGNGVTGLAVTAVPNDPKATYEITGNRDWSVGKNTITIKVTAEDGSTTTYKVNVTRENAKTKSSDKNVDFKIRSSHTIDPEFSNSKNEYNVTVPYEVKNLDLSVIPYDKNTTVKIDGTEGLSTEKTNKVTIKVTAEDGSVRTITLNVTRSEYKANTDLLDLKVKEYEMSPVFKPSVTSYKVTVPHKVKKVTVLVKAPKGATYKITGNKNLQVGNNVVLVKVTDEKGFIKYYQIDVNRKKGFNFFGLGLIPFLILLFLLLILLLLLLLLLRRRKEKKKRKAALLAARNNEDNDTVKQESPVHIDFKPEFNFNSKNGTDDDVVYGGNYITDNESVKMLDNKEEEKPEVKEAEYNIYDNTITKDELVDALNEGIRTKNVDKLQMLLDQENLNRRKRKIKEKEEARKESLEPEDDYVPEHSSYDDNDDDYDEE